MRLGLGLVRVGVRRGVRARVRVMVGSKEVGQLELGFCLGFAFRVRVRVRLKIKVTWG